MTDTQTINVASIGYGEAAKAFQQGWQQANIPVRLRCFDIRQQAETCDTRAETFDGAAMVFSLVTPDQASLALEQCVEYLPKNALVFDCNSCAPDTKRASATLVEAAGCRYVDVAVMSPVHPKLHQTPVSISGPHVIAAKAALEQLGMNVTVVEGDIGAASSIKMIRSIMVKGLEALTMECVLAGRKAGVDEAVLNSLNASFPGFNWQERAAYNLERVTTHGVRRAAEMREVVKTVEQLGLNADMAAATVQWQARVGKMGITADDDYRQTADEITKRI